MPGWWSRGTEIADRATQEMMVARHRRELFADATGTVWEELQATVQPDWQAPAAPEADRTAAAAAAAADAAADAEERARVCAGEWYGSPTAARGRRLFPVWRAAEGASSHALDADALHGLCAAEASTRAALAAEGACHACPAAEEDAGDAGDDAGDGCAPPYSLVLLARLHLAGRDATAADPVARAAAWPCDALRAAWTPAAQASFTLALKTCAHWAVHLQTGGNTTLTVGDTSIVVTDPCPFPVPFSPAVVDGGFLAGGDGPPRVRYTSALYPTKRGREDVRGMFAANERDAYDRGAAGGPLEGVYDTTWEDFAGLYTDGILGKDMTLAVGSAGVTVVAMVVHTRSPFLTLLGLCQILLSFPLAYFVYYFLGGLVFFPFLNFIGIFVVFALGADDVFVAGKYIPL